MAAINFPDSPSVNQTFSAGNKTWIWDGASWNLVVVEAGLHGASHAAAGTDPVTISQSQVNGLSTDLGAKAPISNPTFTGIPAAPTASAGTNTTQVATTAFVTSAVTTAVPSQSGNTGKYLSTDGSLTSWQSVDALPLQTGNTGKFLGTNGTTASWQTVDALPSQTGNAGKTLTTDGTTASWTVPTGGATKSTIFFLGGM